MCIKETFNKYSYLSEPFYFDQSKLMTLQFELLDEYTETFRGNTPAERCGLRLGDRLITVNDVFVVFLTSQEVLQVLNMNNTLVAWLEVER